MVTLQVLTTTSATRTVLTPEVNPGCGKKETDARMDCDEPWLIHVTANGKNDSIHHLWGTHGALSFLVVTTALNTTMTVNWTELEVPSKASVTFDKDPVHVFGFSIPNLILFNDVHDTGIFDNSSQRYVVPMTDFTWEVNMVSNDSDHEVGVSIQTKTFRGTSLPNETKISLQLTAFGEDGRSTLLPHLLTTPDSAQMDMILDHLDLNLTSDDNELYVEDERPGDISGFANARWAMDLVIFSSEEIIDGEEGIQLSARKSLDDENTPGVFHLYEVMTSLARNGQQGGYMQWRPVSYLSSDRDINVATNPNINSSFTLLKEISQPLKESLSYAVFGDELVGKRTTAKSVVSFGLTNDKFYLANNYTTWTVALGHGTPPDETFSTLVIAVIAVGVSIPVLMFLIGGTVIVSRKCRRSSQPLIQD